MANSSDHRVSKRSANAYVQSLHVHDLKLYTDALFVATGVQGVEDRKSNATGRSRAQTARGGIWCALWMNLRTRFSLREGIHIRCSFSDKLY